MTIRPPLPSHAINYARKRDRCGTRGPSSLSSQRRAGPAPAVRSRWPRHLEPAASARGSDIGRGDPSRPAAATLNSTARPSRRVEARDERARPRPKGWGSPFAPLTTCLGREILAERLAADVHVYHGHKKGRRPPSSRHDTSGAYLRWFGARQASRPRHHHGQHRRRTTRSPGSGCPTRKRHSGKTRASRKWQTISWRTSVGRLVRVGGGISRPYTRSAMRIGSIGRSLCGDGGTRRTASWALL